MSAITIESLTEQHRLTLAIIGKLTDDRNAKIQKLAELKMGYKDLLISVYDGSTPMSDLDHNRAEMQQLQWITENEPTSQAAAVFHQQLQAISKKMDELANHERVIAAELKYRKQFNLVLLTDKIDSVRDWDILESYYQRYHFDDLKKLRELRGDFNMVPESVRLMGFVAYAAANGCEKYNEVVTMENINQPRA
jgi:hypothetical protein